MKNFVNRLVAGSVIFVLTVNPALAALKSPVSVKNPVSVVDVAPNRLATGVVLDPNNHQTDLKQAANGTTVVDIAAPTAKGVSQNNFSEFNVDQAGIIFNNSQGPVLTQLGGWSDGNRRLAGGTAKIILTQVTGNNRSQLQGQVEIAGQAADFILANANGITCNGCGFINTPRVSLVTGNAQYGADGALGFNVFGGDVSIEGDGLNANNITRFDIISRAAKINAVIYANQLNIITGKNSVDYSQGTITNLADTTNNTPILFAIDSSLLGGMYGNNIRLIGTEKGLGVNTQGMIQSIGDLEISADGDIQLKNAQANNALKIQSASGAIDNQGTIYGKNVSVSASKDIANNGLLAAEESLNLAGDNFNQVGSVYSGLKANNTLTGTGILSANFKGVLNNSNDFFAAGAANLQVTQLNNSGAFILQSEKNIAGITQIKNTGTVQFNTQDSVSLTAQSLDNQTGILSYSGSGTFNINVNQDANNNQGTINSHGDLNLSANNLNNSGGVIAAQATHLQLNDFNNSFGTLETSQLTLSADHLNNQQGLITAINNSQYSLTSSISLKGDLDNQQGVVYFSQPNSNLLANSYLSARSIHNAAGLLVFANQSAATINALADIDNHSGLIQSGDLILNTQKLDNTSGQVIAAQAQLNAVNIINSTGQLQADSWKIKSENYTSAGGVVLSTNKSLGGISLLINQNFNQTQGAVTQTLSGNLQITANAIDNSDSAIYNLDAGQLNISSINLDNKNGAISGDGATTIAVGQLHNRLGFVAGKDLTLTATTVANNSGVIRNNGAALNIIADALDNTQGVLTSAVTSNISIKNSFNNSQGVINSGALLSLNANDFDNRAGSVVSASDLNLTTLQNINNDAGQMIATGTLNANSKQFNNGTGLVSAKSLALQSDLIDVALNGTLQAEHLSLTAPKINNGGFIFASGSLSKDLSLNTQSFLNKGTLEAASTDWDLSTLAFTNDHGSIVHDGTGELRLGSAANALVFDNSNSVIATKGTLTLNAQSINNTSGTLIAAENLNVQLNDLTNNFGVLQSGGDFNLTTTNLDNTNGALVLNGEKDANLIILNLLTNKNGAIIYGGNSELNIDANNLDNSAGKIASQNNLSIITKNAITNDDKSLISAANQLSLTTASQTNQGEISAQHLVLNVTDFTNADKANIDTGDISLANIDRFSNAGNIHLLDTQATSKLGAATYFNNTGLIETSNLTTEIAGLQFNNAGTISSLAGKLLSTATQLNNDSGQISAQQVEFNSSNNSIISVSNQNGSLVAGSVIGYVDQFNNQLGLLQANQFNLTTNNFDNSNGGVVISTGTAQSTLNTTQWNNNSGSLAIDQLNWIAGAVSNQQGKITAKSLDLKATDIDNTVQGKIAAINSLSISATNMLNNQNGIIQSNSLGLNKINAKTINNADGSIALLGAGTLRLTADQLIQNNLSELYSKFDLQLNINNDFDNAGSIQAENILNITAANVNNSLATSSLLAEQIILNAANTANAGHIEASKIQIAGTNATNSGVMIASATNGEAMQFVLTGNLLNQGTLENNGSDWALSRVDNQGTIQLTGAGLLDLSTIDNKSSGKIYSNGDIKISGDLVTGTFNNAGIVSALNNLEVQIGNTNNQNGKLIAGSNITVTGVSLENQLGVIASQSIVDEALKFNLTGLLDNSNNGQIESASNNWTLQNLTLDNTGGIVNHLGTGNFTIDSQGDLKNSAGTIQSNGNLVVNAFDLGANVNNNQGLIRGKTVRITANNSILNTGVDATRYGEISGGDLTLTANTINNTFGHLIANDASNGNITFITPNTIKNISGEISSRAQDWQLNLDQFDNTGGSILHTGTGTLTLTSVAQLNNAGTISSVADVILNSAGLDNSGKIVSDKNLTINSSGNIINQLTGVISVNGDLTVNKIGVANIDLVNLNEISSGGKFGLDIGVGNFSNGGNVVFNVNPLSINSSWNLNTLNNSGTLSHNSAGAFDIAANSIINDGDIYSEIGTLNFTATNITNNREILASQFTASGVSSFKNTAGSKLSANQIQINNAQTVAGFFENYGIVEAAGNNNSLSIYTSQFNNLVNGQIATNSDDQYFYGDFSNAGIFTHAGTGSLELGKNGTVTVNANSEINSAGTINVLNSISGAGKVFAVTGIDIDTGANPFTNNGATLYTKQNFNIYSAIDNQANGQLVSDGLMNINTIGTVVNAGLIQGQSLQLSAQSLTNNKNVFSVGGAIGHITAQAITNNGNIGASSNEFSITAKNGSIDNTATGVISAENALELSASNNTINNRGSIATNGILTIKNADQLINTGGFIYGDSLDLNLNKINNSSGTINATGSSISSLIATATTADAFDNTNGKIYANSTDLTINSSGTFDNTAAGQVNHYGLGNLTFTAQSLTTDSNSKLLSNGGVELRVTSQLNNAGEISALNLNHIIANDLVNTGTIGSRAGEVKLDLTNFTLTNTSGTINGFQKLTIDAQSIGNAAALESASEIHINTNEFTQFGNINSNNLLSITLGKGDLTLSSSDSIKAHGSLSITLNELGKGFNNSGTISSVNAMTLNGSFLNNYAGGHIDVGMGAGLLNILGDITNAGTISAKQNLVIKANNFTNTVGAEVITGGDLSFTLTNGDFANNNIIFSAGKLDVAGAKNINSNSSAELRSLGDMTLTASDSIINTEARIESGANMVLSAPNRIENNSTPAVITFTPYLFKVDLTGFAYPDPYYNQVNLFGPYIDENNTGTAANAASIKTAKIYANGNLNLEGGSSATVKNNEGEIFAGGDIILNANTWIGTSTAEGDYFRRIYLGGTPGFQLCEPAGSTNCITTTAYYWDHSPIISTLRSATRLFGYTHANGSITTSLSNINNDINFITSPGSTRAPTDTSGVSASAETGSAANNKTEIPVDVNGNPVAGGSTKDGSYNGATVTLADLQAGTGANGKPTATATGAGANTQKGNATQSINYLNAIDANQLKAFAQSGALTQLLAQLNGGNLTPQQVLDLINQIRSGKNPFTTDQALQDFLASVNGWFTANLSEADKESLLAKNELNVIAAKAKEQLGNTQAPTLIQIDILPYGFNLDNLSGLFVINNNPNSRYLIETRPEFTQYTTFLGSDYLLDQLGLDPDKTQKRLGDAFFENQLIKDSLMRDVSMRYLDGALNDFAMMQLLMDNAVQENKTLHLAVGLELTPEQCAHLTQDILWLVEKTVKGQKVLVPRLYLTSVSKDKLEASTSALAAGGSIELTAKNSITNSGKIVANNLLMSTQGSLDQKGTLIAHGDIRLLADQNIRNIGKISGATIGVLAKGDITNKGTVTASDSLQLVSTEGSVINAALNGKDGQLKAGGTLSIAAKNDIKNQQGKMEGNDVSLFTKTGDIIFEAPAAGTRSNGAKDLIAHHDLQMDAGHNIELQATKIKADNTISLHAANDINLTATENKVTTASKSKGKKSSTEIITHDVGSLEAANGNIIVDAGHDINLQGTQVSAGKAIALKAANDVNLLAVEDSNTSESSTTATKKRIGGLGGVARTSMGLGGKPGVLSVDKSKITSSEKNSESNFQVVNLNAGSGVQIDAGHDANLQGTQIKAVGDISIAAKNDLNFNSVENKKHSESIGKNKKIIDDKVTHTLVNIESTGGNVQLNAANDANLIGTNITADKNISIHAERDTNISAVVDSTYHYDQIKKKSGGVLTSKTKTTTNETLKETAVGGAISGENILINAHVNDEGNVIGDKSGNVNLLGASITAKSNVIISADEDVNASGIQTQDNEFHRVKKSGSMGMSSRDKGSVEKNTNLTNVNIGAKENVIMLADNIKLVGTNVTATNGNINMEAVDQLLVSAGEISQTVNNWNNKSGVFTGGKIYSTHEHKDGITETSTQASNITAGGIVTAKAGAIKIEGSKFAGDKGVGLSADSGDIEISAASTHSEAYTHDKDLTVGMGDIGKNLSRPDKWVKNENGRASVKFADAQYADVGEKTKITGSQASTIESVDGNVIANASAGKINIAGSDVTATKGTVGLIGTNGVDITTVTEATDYEKKSTVATAEMSVVVQHQAAEVVVAVLNLDKARKKLEEAKKDYKNYERNLDGLQTQLKSLEADYLAQNKEGAAKTPGVNYDDIVELRQLISDTKGDASFYKAGIALAALNVTTSAITLAQQIATAAASTGTYGFNAGVQLDLDATKTKTETHDTFETGSTISAKDIVIQTGKLGDDGKRDAKGTTTNIHGSKINATDSVVINTGELNVTAGEATHESSTETQHGHITAQVTIYGAAGGASISGSFDQNKNSERSNTYNNSEITGDKIDITTTDDANFRGATVRAESELNMDVGGDLNVESVQNRTSSRSTGFGVSGGMSFSGNASTKTDHTHGVGDVNGASGVNGGINVSNGRSSTKETVLTSLTSGGVANINVKGHTQLTGAEIATTDENGNDLNNLNFSTGSFNFTDLKNTNYSSNTAIGVSANFSLNDSKKPGDKAEPNTQINESKGANGKTLKASSSNLTFSNSQTNDASKTLATLGHGNITVGGIEIEKNGVATGLSNSDSLLAGLNRDTTKIDKSLWSSSTSQSVDVTLDHRMFSEGGRAEIKDQITHLPENLGKVGIDTVVDVVALGTVVKSTVDLAHQDVSLFGGNNTTSLSKNIQVNLGFLSGVVNLENSNPDVLNSIADGNATAKDREKAFNQLGKSITDVLGTNNVDVHMVVQDYDKLNTREYAGTDIHTQILGAFVPDSTNLKNENPNATDHIFLVDDHLGNTRQATETYAHDLDHSIQYSFGSGLTGNAAEKHADRLGERLASTINFVQSLYGGNKLGDTNTHNGINFDNDYIKSNVNLFNSQDKNLMDYRQIAGVEATTIRDLAREEKFSQVLRGTVESKEKRLTQQTLLQIDSSYAGYREDLAAAFVLNLGGKGESIEGGDGKTYLKFKTANESEYKNHITLKPDAKNDDSVSSLYQQIGDKKLLSYSFGDGASSDPTASIIGGKLQSYSSSANLNAVDLPFYLSLCGNNCTSDGYNKWHDQNVRIATKYDPPSKPVRNNSSEPAKPEVIDEVADVVEAQDLYRKKIGATFQHINDAVGVGYDVATLAVPSIGVADTIYHAPEIAEFIAEHPKEILEVGGAATVGLCLYKARGCAELIADTKKYIGNSVKEGFGSSTKDIEVVDESGVVTKFHSVGSENVLDVKPSGNYSKLDDSANTYRSPCDGKLRACDTHAQQTGSFVREPDTLPAHPNYTVTGTKLAEDLNYNMIQKNYEPGWRSTTNNVVEQGVLQPGSKLYTIIDQNGLNEMKKSIAEGRPLDGIGSWASEDNLPETIQAARDQTAVKELWKNNSKGDLYVVELEVRQGTSGVPTLRGQNGEVYDEGLDRHLKGGVIQHEFIDKDAAKNNLKFNSLTKLEK